METTLAGMAIARQSDDALPQSYYEASARTERIVYPPLGVSGEADVCVIGGGFAGLHTALSLVESGRRVVLLEARRIGWGASGRNGGQVIPEFACGEATLTSALGTVDGAACWQLAQGGAQALRDRITRYQIDCDYVAGHLEVAVSARRFARLQRASAAACATGRYRLIGPVELPRFVGSRRYFGGVLDPAGGHLHPVKLALGLGRALTSLGAAVHEQTPVSGWDASAAGITVRCLNGASVRCSQLVLAVNVGAAGLTGPGMRAQARRILPVGTWVIATEPLDPALADEVLPSRAAVADNRMVMDYFRLSRDRRMVFGGGCSYLGNPTPRGFAEQLRRRMDYIFPQLSTVPVEFAWGGMLDISMSRAPDLGRVPGEPRVVYAQGFSGSGLVATQVAGRVIADALNGQTQQLALFERIGHRAFPGGRLMRAPITTAGMLYHRLLDLF